MNFSTLFGIAAACLVLWFGVIAPSAKPSMFLDPHALILVVGGTIAAGFIAFPFKKFRDLGSFIMLGVLYPEKKAHLKVADEILRLASFPNSQQPLDDDEMKFHPFLVEGFKLMQRRRLTLQEMKQVLLQRSQRFKDRYTSDAKTLNALAKFPPAFGLLGATTGMISMMTGLGAAGQDSIGPAMAVALVATFWGIAVANLVLLPLSDHATKLAADDSSLREMIIVGLILIHEEKRPGIVFEHMLGYLSVNDRRNPALLATVRATDARFVQSQTPLHDVIPIRSDLSADYLNDAKTELGTEVRTEMPTEIHPRRKAGNG